MNHFAIRKPTGEKTIYNKKNISLNENVLVYIVIRANSWRSSAQPVLMAWIAISTYLRPSLRVYRIMKIHNLLLPVYIRYMLT